MSTINLKTNRTVPQFGVFFMLLLALTGCGGGGSSGAGLDTSAATPDPVVVPPTPEPIVYSVSGSVLDEVEAPIEGALVSVDGIEAVALSDAAGQFVVQSDSAFADSIVVTASKDGFDAFGAVVTLSTGSANNSFVLDTVVAMATNDPWGFIEITVTPGGGGKSLIGDSPLFPSELMSNAVTKACDCEIDIAGKVYRKGSKKSALYIMLVVDASGSTNDSLGNKRVFDVEIDALKALVDNLSVNDSTFVGVIKFATGAEIVTEFTTDFDFVKTALSSINPEVSGTSGAATNYQAALELAKSTFDSANLKKKDIKTVAFLSDGIPTAPVGSGSTQEAGDRIAGIEMASILADAGISVNTFPVNVLSNLTTLPAISAITEGLYFHHQTDEVESKLPSDSLVGIIGLEVENVTTSEQALDLVLRPDGVYSGKVCLTAGAANEIQVTPSVCETCEKIAYQKIKVNCTAEECSTCAGQVTNLQMQYTGTVTDAVVRITQRKNANKVYTLFDDTVQPGESLDFSGAAKDRTMGSGILVYVNDVLNAEITTSCGQSKIGPGLVEGDFLVLKGYSRNGGLLCPVD